MPDDEKPKEQTIKFRQDSASITFEDASYNPNDMLAFVASMNDSNSDSDDELNSYRAEFFDNLVQY